MVLQWPYLSTRGQHHTNIWGSSRHWISLNASKNNSWRVCHFKVNQSQEFIPVKLLWAILDWGGTFFQPSTLQIFVQVPEGVSKVTWSKNLGTRDWGVWWMPWQLHPGDVLSSFHRSVEPYDWRQWSATARAVCFNTASLLLLPLE